MTATHFTGRWPVISAEGGTPVRDGEPAVGAQRRGLVSVTALWWGWSRGLSFSHRFSGEVEGVGVVDEPIEDGIGQGGIVEVGVPVVHGELAGDHGGSAVVAVVEEFQQVAAAARRSSGARPQSSRIRRSVLAIVAQQLGDSGRRRGPARVPPAGAAGGSSARCSRGGTPCWAKAQASQVLPDAGRAGDQAVEMLGAASGRRAGAGSGSCPDRAGCGSRGLRGRRWRNRAFCSRYCRRRLAAFGQFPIDQQAEAFVKARRRRSRAVAAVRGAPCACRSVASS